MPSAARPRESGDPVLSKALDARFAHGGIRRCGSVRRRCLVDRRADGTIYLKSARTLPDYPEQADGSAGALGDMRAGPRVHGGTRSPTGSWRTITYAQTLEKVRRIGAALLTRNLSAERPIVILSGNDLEHALLGLAANYVGIPYAPVSPAYSLISSDFGKLSTSSICSRPGSCSPATRNTRARSKPSCRPSVEVIVGVAQHLAAERGEVLRVGAPAASPVPT